MIRYYEVRREEPFLLRLSEYRNSSPQKSLGKMGKRGLDFGRCEIFRFYKLHPNNWIEVLPMYCPRRVRTKNSYIDFYLVICQSFLASDIRKCGFVDVRTFYYLLPKLSNFLRHCKFDSILCVSRQDCLYILCMK